jgi:hypothetical protein
VSKVLPPISWLRLLAAWATLMNEVAIRRLTCSPAVVAKRTQLVAPGPLTVPVAAMALSTVAEKYIRWPLWSTWPEISRAAVSAVIEPPALSTVSKRSTESLAAGKVNRRAPAWSVGVSSAVMPYVSSWVL